MNWPKKFILELGLSMNHTDKYKELFSGLGLDKKTSDEFVELITKTTNKIASDSFIGESGAGLIKVTGRGDFKITKVEIAPEIFKETEIQLVSDLFVAAVNNLQNKIYEASEKAQYQLDLDLRALLYGKTN